MPTPGGTTARGLGCDYERVARPMRANAVGQPCPRCGVTMGKGRSNPFAATVDHIVPRALGGTNAPGNFRVLCRRCNCSAGARMVNAKRRGRRRAVAGFFGPLSTR